MNVLGRYTDKQIKGHCQTMPLKPPRHEHARELEVCMDTLFAVEYYEYENKPLIRIKIVCLDKTTRAKFADKNYG